jgi:ribonuclease HII
MDFLSEQSELLATERNLWREGFCFVAGVDEVGRGPLAGPVVAAAVIFPDGRSVPDGVDDSKKLTAAKRESIERRLRDDGLARIAVSELGPAEIDVMNILEASREAMRRAVRQLAESDFALIDGLPVPQFPVPSLALVKGDTKSASIAAASIIAKVYRDRFMQRYEDEFPGYGFASNMGYPTAAHLDALERKGPTPIHRRSFGPVRQALGLDPVQMCLNFDA